MPVAPYKIKRNDTDPPVQADLEFSDGRQFDIVGATINFVVRRQDSNTALLKRAATSAVTVSDTVKRVTYEWQSGDTVAAGDYFMEWEITFLNGRKVTFPNDRQQVLQILPDAG